MWKKTVLLLAILWLRQCRSEVERNRQRNSQEKPPNIFFFLADDFGWNDIGFHNKDIKTPTLDKLANDGVILNQSYVQNLCSPSRAALMTGYYPFRTGMQTLAVPQFAPMGLPLQFKLLPEKLKELGYGTHIVGKWHLGGCNPAYLPFNRGFDSSFGFMAAGELYYEHSLPFVIVNAPTPEPGVPKIYDFFNQSEAAWNYKGTYSSIPFVKQVKHLLNTVNPDQLQFFYLPFQLTHFPLEVPQDKIALYPNISNVAIRTFSAMVSQLDHDVNQMINEIKKTGFYENSVIIFTGDNGGEVNAGGNNYPFKGSKHTLWEGGHRAAAFVHSPLLKKKGYTYNGMIHIVDWFATLLTLAGGKPDANLDGVDVWPAISNNLTSPRTELVYHLENIGKQIVGAIRFGDYKLILDKAGLPNYAVPPNNVTSLHAYMYINNGQIFLLDIPNYPPYRVFNLKDDPTEDVDLALTNPAKLKELQDRVEELKQKMVFSVYQLNNLTLYQELNGVKELGLDWCKPVQNVTIIDWNGVIPNDHIPIEWSAGATKSESIVIAGRLAVVSYKTCKRSTEDNNLTSANQPILDQLPDQIDFYKK